MIDRLQFFYDASLNYLNQGIQTKIYIVVIAMLLNSLATAGISYFVGRNQIPTLQHCQPAPTQPKAAKEMFKVLRYSDNNSERW